MKYNDDFFDVPLHRIGTSCRKWDFIAKKYGKDMLPFFVADMDFRSPLQLSQALESRSQHGTFGYNFSDSKEILELTGYLNRHHHINVSVDDIVPIPNVVSGLKLSVRNITKVNDGVIIQPPVYGSFFKSILLNQRTIAENPLLRDVNLKYSIDFKHLENLFAQGYKVLIFCNPHNPVSRCWREHELDKLMALVVKYNVFIISDEIHCDLVYKPNRFISMLNIAKKYSYSNVACLYAPSKTFNVAGLKQAFMVSPNNDFLNRVQMDMESSGVESENTFGLIASEIVFSQCDDWREALLNYLFASKEILLNEFSSLHSIKISPIEATYMAWLDFREYGYSSSELMTKFLKQGIVLTEGTAFSEHLGDGFMRFNFACPRKMMLQGLESIKKALH